MTTGIKKYLGGGRRKTQTFTANGTFKVPEGVTEVYITGGGAGGGANAYSGGSYFAGQAGTPTSFGSLLTLSGGGGGGIGVGGAAGGMGGSQGGGGQALGSVNEIFNGADGGGSGYFTGGKGAQSGQKGGDGMYCCGGGGGAYSGTSGSFACSGGGGGDFVIDRRVPVTPLSEIAITIGKGGAAGMSNISGKGGDGILIIEWWE